MMRAGRPAKQIEKTDFEALLSIQCTLEEVRAFFDMKLGGCSDDTIERWCKRTYGKNFADVSAEKRAIGRISLRRTQFELAKKNATLSIWLGKQYLGQRDEVVVDAGIRTKDDALSASLREMAKELESDED